MDEETLEGNNLIKDVILYLQTHEKVCDENESVVNVVNGLAIN